MGILLVILQSVRLHAWCTLCLARKLDGFQHRDFWIAEKGRYALALQGDKRVVVESD